MNDVTGPGPEIPVATCCVAGLLAVVYLLQLTVGGHSPYAAFTPSDGGMLRLGALEHGRVFLDGEWWRLFTAPLLHGGFVHILFNGVWLILAGNFVERYVGGWTVTGVLAVCAIAGSLLSVSTMSNSIYSVGASGAIVGLGAAGVVLALFGDRADEFGTGHKGQLAQLVVMSLIPASGGVDYAAHFGGAIAGGLCGLALLFRDEPEAVSPGRRRLGQFFTYAYLGVVIFALVRMAQS